ncbi:MAG: vanadium-dependent haloperoxidase [Solirubrobacteraceae bacterium]
MRAISSLGLLIAGVGAATLVGAGPSSAQDTPATQCAPAAAFAAASTPVAYWSTETRCAIVPPAAGPENFGNKFPGEAALYMGIVHIAIYDAAVAIDGGYRPFLPTPAAPANTSPAAAIAAAAHDTLEGLQPALGLKAGQQAILDSDYAAYLAGIPDGSAKTNGLVVGRQAAAAVIAWRTNDGRDANPTLADLDPPAPGPGIWQPDPTRPVLGLRLPGIRPLGLISASQFRPEGPLALTSQAYREDLNQVDQLGGIDSSSRTREQTEQALFWTDHDLRMWNDGLLRLATGRHLDLVQTARMLAMAHVAGGDALIACFDAKYHYWFWRPYQAIAAADTDGTPNTSVDPTWRPLATTPNFPEYPSGHACHSTAVVTALDAFFGTDEVPMTLDSRVTHTTRRYDRLHDIVKDVDWARVLVGFHFRNSDLQGTTLGRKVARYVTDNYFEPVG